MDKSEIDELIVLFDLKMISSGKKHLPLRTANEIINHSHKFKNINLKELLREGKIPNAYQTETLPKQWRIPFSNINNYAEKRKEYLRNNPKGALNAISEFEGFRRYSFKRQQEENQFQDLLEYQKDQSIKYAIYSTICFGFFFPFLWIISIVLFFVKFLRRL